MSGNLTTINGIQNNHMEQGKDNVRQLLDDNPDIVAVAAVLVRRNGSLGFSLTHIEGPAKLALIGGCDVLNRHIARMFVEENLL